MKSTLEFNLPDEQEELNMALNGHKYSIVLDDLDSWLRNISKYQGIAVVSIEEVRDKIIEFKQDRGLYE